MPIGTVPPEVRFWRHVQKTECCWEWRGHRNKKGYGKFSISWRENRIVLAHRFSWALHFGPVPDGKMVLHHCDNPACVNPDHLFIGCARENAIDMFKRGRSRAMKLLPVQAEAIRTARGKESAARLAAQYGLHPTRIRKIWRFGHESIQGSH